MKAIATGNRSSGVASTRDYRIVAYHGSASYWFRQLRRGRRAPEEITVWERCGGEYDMPRSIEVRLRRALGFTHD